METKSKKINGNDFMKKNRKGVMFLMAAAFLFFTASPVYSHCDSYDGPVVKDALMALEKNNVKLVLKWISSDQELEIISLFKKTYSLRNGDKEIYSIVEKHFLETLVRLHRQTEGASFTGLKPAGSTKPIIKMSDKTIADGNIDGLLTDLSNHAASVIGEKYRKVAGLYKEKDDSELKGREYVKAYIDFTHTLEAMHDIIDHAKSENPRHEH